jgi:hypothetical protein
MTHSFYKFGESRLRAQGVTSGVAFRDCIHACVDAMECGDLDVNVCFHECYVWDYLCICSDERMLRRLCALKPDLNLFWRTTCSTIWMIHYPGNLLQMEYLWQDLQLVHAYVQWASHGQQSLVTQAELSRRLKWMDGTRRAWLLAVVSC